MVAVLGAGTLGLLVIAALEPPGGRRAAARRRRAVLVGARYAHQQRLARELGGTEALPPDQLARAVRRHSRSLSYGGPSGVTATLSGGADVVIDCVGSAESIAQSLAMVRPAGDGGAGRHAGQGDGRPGAAVAPRGPPGRGLRLRDRTRRASPAAGRPPSRWPSRWRRRSGPAASCRPPTRSPASRTPWPTPAPPDAVAP